MNTGDYMKIMMSLITLISVYASAQTADQIQLCTRRDQIIRENTIEFRDRHSDSTAKLSCTEPTTLTVGYDHNRTQVAYSFYEFSAESCRQLIQDLNSNSLLPVNFTFAIGEEGAKITRVTKVLSGNCGNQPQVDSLSGIQ